MRQLNFSCSASTSLITRRATAAAAGLVLMLPAKVINAFHSAQPRPRAQVGASAGSAARNASSERVSAIDALGQAQPVELRDGRVSVQVSVTPLFITAD